MHSVTVQEDSEPPQINGCPQSAIYTIPHRTTARIITWTEPTATDNSNTEPAVTQTHQSGNSFPVGTTRVTYTFTDQSGNDALCSFVLTGKVCLTNLCPIVFGVLCLQQHEVNSSILMCY